MKDNSHPPELRDLVDIPRFLGPRPVGAPTIGGVSPRGEPILWKPGLELTLLLFLSTTCEGCRDLWTGSAALVSPSLAGVFVTKGPGSEDPERVCNLAGEAFVVMSDQAWDDYQVPTGPFFVLVDGRRGRVATEGVALSFPSVLRATEAAIARI